MNSVNADSRGEHTPYSRLNAQLESRLSDARIYTSGEWCFLKPMQQALHHASGQMTDKLLRHYFRLPVWAFRALQWIKGGAAPRQALKETVVMELCRSVENSRGEKESMYFARILACLDRDRVSVVAGKSGCDCPHDEVLDATAPLPRRMRRAEVSMLRHCRQCLRQVKESGQFSREECHYIATALHVFFTAFRRYYHFFRDQPVKTCLFAPHYLNEGLIAALRVLGIKSVEIQHGLIAANDYYYVYPAFVEKIRHKAMFPDRILVYGPYWKRVLMRGFEFAPGQVDIGGDYLYHENTEPSAAADKEPLILIAAQKNIWRPYVSYVHWLVPFLRKNHPEWKVAVKLHPLEKNVAAYEALRPLGVELHGRGSALDNLLQRCSIQITIYSTTLYDALGFGVLNLSLQDTSDYADYAADMVREGIALPLKPGEDPVALWLQQGTSSVLERSEVYAPFDKRVFQALQVSAAGKQV